MPSLHFDAYRRIFHHTSYRRFWLGSTFSMLGDAMSRVALTWFVYEQTGSAAALGLLTVAYVGPVLVGGLAAGWLLDRFDRRAVMIADSLLRGLVIGLIPVLYALGLLGLWYVYVAAAVYGALMMISLAGNPALIPSLVEPDQLDTANALETLSFTLSGVIGPPVAGLLIGWIGAPNVAAVDALSYFFFAAALLGVRLKAEEPPEQVAAGSPAPSYGLRDAFRLLAGNPVLLSTTLMFMAFNTGYGLLTVWLPIYVDQAGGGAQGYGLLLGALAVGEVISSALAGGWRPGLSLGTLIGLAQTLSGAGLALMLVSGSLLWAVPCLALLGFFSAPLTIWAQTLRMQVIPPHLRGRTFALLRTLMQGAIPVGGALAGWLLPIVGIPAMIGLSALLVGGPGLAGLQIRPLRAAGSTRAEQPAESVV